MTWLMHFAYATALCLPVSAETWTFKPECGLAVFRPDRGCKKGPIFKIPLNLSPKQAFSKLEAAPRRWASPYFTGLLLVSRRLSRPTVRHFPFLPETAKFSKTLCIMFMESKSGFAKSLRSCFTRYISIRSSSGNDASRISLQPSSRWFARVACFISASGLRVPEMISRLYGKVPYSRCAAAHNLAAQSTVSDHSCTCGCLCRSGRTYRDDAWATSPAPVFAGLSAVEVRISSMSGLVLR